MRNLIGAINITLDGFCDHTAMIADEELQPAQSWPSLSATLSTMIISKLIARNQHSQTEQWYPYLYEI